MATEKCLIDPDEFLEWVVKRFKCVPLVGSCDDDSESIKLLLTQAPTVDAVEVVRCNDCRFYQTDHWCTRVALGIMYENDFCSYGERRECE